MQPSAERRIALVVDTSLARAAGDRTEQARACRDVLQAIRESGLLLALSPELLQEWLKQDEAQHRPYISRFAAQWLVVMGSEGRIVNVRLPAATPLRAALQQVDAAEGVLAERARALLKDLHVIETALWVEQSEPENYEGKRVLSLDKALPREVQVLMPHVSELHAICDVQWVVLVEDLQRRAEDWVRKGAPARPEYQLCDSSSLIPHAHDH